VIRADHVDPHRAHRALAHGIDPGDRAGVDDVGRAAGGLGDGFRVEEVSLDEVKVRMPGELGARERVAMEVVEGDDLVVVDEQARERRPDEPGAAGDEDALSAQGHGGHSSRLGSRAAAG